MHNFVNMFLLILYNLRLHNSNDVAYHMGNITRKEDNSMDYIIRLSDGRYFCGWDPLDGSMKFRTERSLAYRMRRPIATNTVPKVATATHMDCAIEKLAS